MWHTFLKVEKEKLGQVGRTRAVMRNRIKDSNISHRTWVCLIQNLLPRVTKRHFSATPKHSAWQGYWGGFVVGEEVVFAWTSLVTNLGLRAWELLMCIWALIRSDVNYLLIGQPTELELALNFSRFLSLKLQLHLESCSLLENLGKKNLP